MTIILLSLALTFAVMLYVARARPSTLYEETTVEGDATAERQSRIAFDVALHEISEVEAVIQREQLQKTDRT